MAGGTLTAADGPSKPTKPKLAIKFMNELFADEDITCECSDHHPDRGAGLVFCKTCEKWLHMNCMFGANKDFTQQELATGFQCRRCKFEIRQESAKRGYANRLANAADSSSGKKSAPFSAKSKASATDTPLKYKTRSSKVLEPASTPALRQPSKFKLQGQTSTPTRTLTYTPAQPAEDESDMLACEDPGEVITPSKAKTRSKRKEAALASIEEGLDEAIEKWKNATDLPTISCICADGPAGNFYAYLICVRCNRLQHKVCSPKTAEAERLGSASLCKACLDKRHEKMQRVLRQKTREAHRAAKELKQRFEAACKTREAKLTHIISTLMWKEYCNIPDGETAPENVVELTSTYLDGGKSFPIHPAPPQWVAEMKAKIRALVSTENKELVATVAGNDTALLSTDYPAQLRKGLGELAVLSMYQGPLKGKREELGVLAEVLGLVGKGTYWKG